MRSTTRVPVRALGAAVLLAGMALAGCSSSPEPAASPTTAPGAPDGGSTLGTAASPGSTATSGTQPVAGFVLRSTAFADGASIPLRHACTNQGGEAASPPLDWSGVPAGAEHLVLVVHDPDAPRPGGFTHLVTVIPTDASDVADGANQSGTGPMAAWIGPCPPSGEHHYVFTLYAFGSDVALPDPLDKAAVDALAPQALATATLTGLFATQ